MTVANLLKSAIVQLQLIAKALDDVQVAPESPTPTIKQMPFVIAYPDTGEMNMLATGSQNIHTINWEVHVSSTLLPSAIDRSLDLLHLMDLAIKANPTLNDVVNTVVFPTTYYFGRMDWGATKAAHIGARLVVRVKTFQALST